MEHFLFDCDMYKEARDRRERKVSDILFREGLPQGFITLKVLIGEIEGVSRQGKDALVRATLDYINETN